MYHSWAWRRWFLYNDQLSWVPLPCKAFFHGIFPRRSLKSQRLLCCSQGLRPYFEPFSLLGSRSCPGCSLPNLSFLLFKYQVQQSTSSCCVLDYFVMNLLAAHSRNPDCLCLAFNAAAGCLQGLSTWPRPMVWRKHYLILKSVCRTVVSPGLTTYPKMDSYFSAAVKSSVFLLTDKYFVSLCDWSSGKFSSVSQ